MIMKKTNRVLALLTAVILMIVMSVSAFAAEVDSGKGGNASITIKLPAQTTEPTAATTYKIYKVFDATSSGDPDSSAIAYQLVSGKNAPLTATDGLSKFDVDTAGNVHYYSRAASDAEWVLDTQTTELSAAMIEAIAGYVREDDLVCTAVVPAGETSVTVTHLEYGYYYITTSTGTAVTVDSTNPDAEVFDKNVIPPVVKSAGTEYDEKSLQAIAQVGTSQSFTAVITKTHGAVNLVFTDTMTNMVYDGTVTVTVNDAAVDPSAAINTDAENETYIVTGEAGDSTFTVSFDNDYIAGLADGTLITLVYSGTITSDALSVNPATNKATLTSGDGNTSESDEVEVYNAKFTVTKQDGDGRPLANAGFVIMNADDKYYKLDPAAEDDPETDEDESAAPVVTWYELEEGETLEQAIADGKITEYMSGADGAVPAFTGLGAGTYTLVESTVPAGYNRAADYTFTVENNDFTSGNLEQATTVTNNSGTELPSTGGTGTTVLYIVGGLLVLSAAVLLITRRRMNSR